MLIELETKQKSWPIQPLSGAIRRAARGAITAAKRRHASNVAQRHLAQQPDHVLQDIGLSRWEIPIATRTVTTSRHGWRAASGRTGKALPAASTAAARKAGLSG